MRDHTYVFGGWIPGAKENIIGKERLSEMREELRRFFMGFRASGCPQCGCGPYEDQIILEQRIIEANDMHCAILETRRCKSCGHRYSVEMYYRPDGERFIKNEHKCGSDAQDYQPVFGIDWSKE